jgi:dinuclear metal center YbgI/SA1388 family protein
MTTVRDLYKLMDEKAPFSMQESWDSSGLLVGRWDAPVERVLLSLDITPGVIAEAKEQGCGLILSHHPVIFGGTKAVTDADYTGERVLALAEAGIAALCCHTCLDAAPDGVNDELARRCGLTGELELLEQGGVHPVLGPYGIGRVGTLEQPVALTDYLALLRDNLAPNGIRFHDAGKSVRRVAVGGGSCGSMMGEALKLGCDTFVTADLKYDHFLEARAAGLNLIDAGHYPTENPVMDVVENWLREAFPALEVLRTQSHSEPIAYF